MKIASQSGERRKALNNAGKFRRMEIQINK